jgi:hypothetical protein
MKKLTTITAPATGIHHGIATANIHRKKAGTRLQLGTFKISRVSEPDQTAASRIGCLKDITKIERPRTTGESTEANWRKMDYNFGASVNRQQRHWTL